MIYKKIVLGNILVLLSVGISGYIENSENNNHFDKIAWGVSARQGKRNYMEDYYTVETFPNQEINASKKGHFFGVYDGHGGSVISEELKTNLSKTFYHKLKIKEKSIFDALKESLEGIELDLKPEVNQQASEYQDKAGSTAVVAVLDHENVLYIANVGDSRAIIIRDGVVVFSTKDHKPNSSEELDRIKKAGHDLDPIEPQHSPRIRGLSLSRTIGDWEKKNQYPNAIICTPDLYTVTIEPGDILIMASDGLWDVLNNDGVGKLTKKIFKNGVAFTEKDVDRRCDIAAGNSNTMKTVARALREVAYEKKSGDNITVVAVQFDYSPEEQKKVINTSIDVLIRNIEYLRDGLERQAEDELIKIFLNNINKSVQNLNRGVLKKH